MILDALQHAPFEDVARRFSEDISAKDGGNLGLFTLNELTPELQETVRWMKEGEVSPALQTPLGYQILFVEKIEGSTARPMEELKVEVQEKVFQEKVEKQYETWLENLRKQSFIKNNL